MRLTTVMPKPESRYCATVRQGAGIVLYGQDQQTLPDSEGNLHAAKNLRA